MVRYIPQDLWLDINSVPSSYSGRLYFVLGQGLGDTVNAFRILHEVLKYYPQSVPIVYADDRWQDLYSLVPELKRAKIRFYQEGKTPLSQGRGTSNPYTKAFSEIMEESRLVRSFVALGNFKLADQYARKEPQVITSARAIGLFLDKEQIRPYLILPEIYRSMAQRWLKERGLEPGCYFAVAPHSWPDKMWDNKSWELLLADLNRATGLPILIIGVKGYVPIRGKAVTEVLDLPLSLVAALIAQARCYIGLDTGPTHLAACFDLPIVTLNPQGKFPPFLIEPLSPFRWTHLTPGIIGNNPIPVASVFEVVLKAMTCRVPPECPTCGASPYVLGGVASTILFICRCGLIYRDQKKQENISDSCKPVVPALVLPDSLNSLLVLEAKLLKLLSSDPKVDEGLMLSLSFEHTDPVGMNPQPPLTEQGPRELWWNWDSAYAFIKGCGWEVFDSHVIVSDHNVWCSVRIRPLKTSEKREDGTLEIPWGNKIVHLKRSTYEQWLPWSSFRKSEDLEGIGWLLVKNGDWLHGHEILLMTLKLQPRWRTIGRIIKGRCLTALRSVTKRI